jgi:hypothetical protein
MENVKGTKKMWGNVDSYSERGKLWCMARAEVGTFFWALGELKESACKTLWDRNFTLSKLNVYFLAGHSLGNDQKTKDTMPKQMKGLAVNFFDKGLPKLVP